MPTIIGHLISHMENKMPENGYRSDDRGNNGCLLCISKVLELLHSGDKLVRIYDTHSYISNNYIACCSTSRLVILR